MSDEEEIETEVEESLKTTGKQSYKLLIALVTIALYLIFGNIYVTAYHFSKLHHTLNQEIEFNGLNENIFNEVKYASLIKDKKSTLNRVLEVWILAKDNKLVRANRKAAKTTFPRVESTQKLTELLSQAENNEDPEAQAEIRARAMQTCEEIVLEIAKPNVSGTSAALYEKLRQVFNKVGFDHPALPQSA